MHDKNLALDWKGSFVQLVAALTISFAFSGTNLNWQIKNRRIQEVESYDLQIKSVAVTYNIRKKCTRSQAAVKIKTINE